jgi:hypothetical protein
VLRLDPYTRDLGFTSAVVQRLPLPAASRVLSLLGTALGLLRLTALHRRIVEPGVPRETPTGLSRLPLLRLGRGAGLSLGLTHAAALGLGLGRRIHACCLLLCGMLVRIHAAAVLRVLAMLWTLEARRVGYRVEVKG